MKTLTETTEKKWQFLNEEIAQNENILTEEAIDFLTALHENFNAKRLELLEARRLFHELFEV